MPRPKIKSQNLVGDPKETLQNAIKDTLNSKQSDLQLSTIHKACSELVGKEQYDLIFNTLTELLKAHFSNWHDQLSSVAGDPLLTKLCDQYEDFKTYCLLFPRFYMSFDRHFKKEEPEKTLNHIRKLFIQIILSDTNLFKKAATPSIIKVIFNVQNKSDNEMSKSDIEMSNVKLLLEMYYSFKDESFGSEIFSNFIDNLQEQEAEFYERFFSINFYSNPFSKYLTTVSDQYKKEEHIFTKIFQPKEVREFLSNYIFSLLISKQDEFLNGPEPGIAQALASEDQLSLRWFVETYQLFDIDLKPIYSTCACYIMNAMLKRTQDFPYEGNEIKQFNASEQIGKLIDSAIKLSDPYMKLFTSKEAKNKLEDSIKLAWNDEKFNITVNFNDYIDAFVKSNIEDESKDKQLAIIARFYRYLSDKTQFNNIYESAFIRRLIKMRERVFIKELPVINAIKKISTNFMLNYDAYKKQFKDCEIIRSDFEQLSEDNGKNKYVKIEPMIFDRSIFPLPNEEETNIPVQVTETNKAFIDFFSEKFKQRTLSLVWSGSTVQLTLKFARRNYTVITDLPCGTLILALNEKSMKFSEIANLLQNKAIAAKVVKKLSEAGHKLLKREKDKSAPEGSKSLSDNDVFSLNPDFYHKLTSVVIPPIASERKAALDLAMVTDRREKRDSINAAIVRLLKQNKKYEMGKLEREVIALLSDSFTCPAENVRRRVVELEGSFVRREIIDGETIIFYNQ